LFDIDEQERLRIGDYPRVETLKRDVSVDSDRAVSVASHCTNCMGDAVIESSPAGVSDVCIATVVSGAAMGVRCEVSSTGDQGLSVAPTVLARGTRPPGRLTHTRAETAISIRPGVGQVLVNDLWAWTSDLAHVNWFFR